MLYKKKGGNQMKIIKVKSNVVKKPVIVPNNCGVHKNQATTM